MTTPGGGGYGDPRQRDPELVRADVIAGYITPQAAKRDYAPARAKKAPARRAPKGKRK